jgi:hypothetical protein
VNGIYYVTIYYVIYTARLVLLRHSNQLGCSGPDIWVGQGNRTCLQTFDEDTSWIVTLVKTETQAEESY